MELLGLYQAIILALATAAISVTVSKAQVFASARTWIASRSLWLGELVSCPYCTSHWTGIALVAVYRPILVSQWIAVDLLVSVFAVVAIAAIIIGVIVKLNPFPSRNDETEQLVFRLREALKTARSKLVEQASLIKEMQE